MSIVYYIAYNKLFGLRSWLFGVWGSGIPGRGVPEGSNQKCFCVGSDFFCPIRPGLEAVPGIVLTAQALQHFSDAQLRAKSKSSNLVETTMWGVSQN